MYKVVGVHTEEGAVYSIAPFDKLTQVKRVRHTMLKPIPDVSPLYSLPCAGLESAI